MLAEWTRGAQGNNAHRRRKDGERQAPAGQRPQQRRARLDDALAGVSRERRRELCDAVGLEIADRRQVGLLLAALVEAPAVDLGDLLGRLKREELQGACDLLETKKSTRLFSVFGAPDVKVHKDADGLVAVELRGVDLYDPTTGETAAKKGEDVAAWFVDHDYDGRTFCICQALFPGRGTKNPWEKLQKALKAGRACCSTPS